MDDFTADIIARITVNETLIEILFAQQAIQQQP